MRRDSSAEDSEWANTSATKSMSFATWIVTMRSVALPCIWSDVAGDADPPSRAECAIGCLGVLAKNRQHVHAPDAVRAAFSTAMQRLTSIMHICILFGPRRGTVDHRGAA